MSLPSPGSVTLSSDCEEATESIGAVIGAALSRGQRVGLGGELGAGKTCLVRGLAAGLDVPEGVVRSPSFPVILPYEGGRLPLYHIDLFRRGAAAGEPEELREYLYGDGVAAVEWFERLSEPLTDFLSVSLTFVATERRCIVVAAQGVGYDRVLEELGKFA